MFEENPVLNVKRFDALSEEWLEFIKENRSKGGLQHKYDVIIGPVADDNKVNNQVSFHTEKALQYLQLTRRDSYARNDL